jgi:hypothetical protein
MDNMNMEAEAVVMKVCSRCKTPKEATADNFPRNKSSKDGLSHWCKACHKEHRANKKKGDAAPVVVQNIIAGAMDPTDT